jgi:hypothetical protein
MIEEFRGEFNNLREEMREELKNLRQEVNYLRHGTKDTPNT